MSRESTNSPEVVAIRLERVPVIERLTSLLYAAMFGLMLTVLWAMGEAHSLEAKTIQCLPFPAEMIKAASEAGNEPDAAPAAAADEAVQAPTDRSTSSRVVTPSATSW